MKLIGFEEGLFPELDNYNAGFNKGSRRLKVTIDTLAAKTHYIENYPELLFNTLDLLPNIRNHRCSHGENEHAGRDYDMSHIFSPIKIVGDVIDTVHLFEHVALEIQCQVAEMQECSGLTCNYWEPETRYDVFIEYEEAPIAEFSCLTSLKLINSQINTPEEPFNIRDVLMLATTIARQEVEDASSLSSHLGWSNGKLNRIIAELQELKFPFSAHLPAA